MWAQETSPNNYIVVSKNPDYISSESKYYIGKFSISNTNNNIVKIFDYMYQFYTRNRDG